MAVCFNVFFFLSFEILLALLLSLLLLQIQQPYIKLVLFSAPMCVRIVTIVVSVLSREVIILCYWMSLCVCKCFFFYFFLFFSVANVSVPAVAVQQLTSQFPFRWLCKQLPMSFVACVSSNANAYTPKAMRTCGKVSVTLLLLSLFMSMYWLQLLCDALPKCVKRNW